MRARTKHGYKTNKRSNPDYLWSRNPHGRQGRWRHLDNRKVYRDIRQDEGRKGLRERGII